MSQPLKKNNLFKFGAVLLGLFASLYLLASKRFGKSKATRGVKMHKPATNPDGALKYWTADKMRHAAPVDLPQVGGEPQSPRQA